MSDKLLESIDSRLKTISKLIALQTIKGRQFQEQVQILHSMGMLPNEIADCLGKTPNHVRVAIHSLKKKSKKEEVKNE